ncbi:hypothetical protein HDU67_009687 [Dinochytrium kinnereticum]|nr:hypothetical protein HDU67_009687 [Dinochytrium kinnereticum]
MDAFGASSAGGMGKRPSVGSLFGGVTNQTGEAPDSSSLMHRLRRHRSSDLRVLTSTTFTPQQPLSPTNKPTPALISTSPALTNDKGSPWLGGGSLGWSGGRRRAFSTSLTKPNGQNELAEYAESGNVVFSGRQRAFSMAAKKPLAGGSASPEDGELKRGGTWSKWVRRRASLGGLRQQPSTVEILPKSDATVEVVANETEVTDSVSPKWGSVRGLWRMSKQRDGVSTGSPVSYPPSGESLDEELNLQDIAGHEGTDDAESSSHNLRVRVDADRPRLLLSPSARKKLSIPFFHLRPTSTSQHSEVVAPSPPRDEASPHESAIGGITRKALRKVKSLESTFKRKEATSPASATLSLSGLSTPSLTNESSVPNTPVFWGREGETVEKLTGRNAPAKENEVARSSTSRSASTSSYENSNVSSSVTVVTNDPPADAPTFESRSLETLDAAAASFVKNTETMHRLLYSHELHDPELGGLKRMESGVVSGVRMLIDAPWGDLGRWEEDVFRRPAVGVGVVRRRSLAGIE